MRQILVLILLFVVGQWFVKALRRAQSQSRPGAQPCPNPQNGQGGQGVWRASNGSGASRAAGGASGTSGAASAQGTLPEPMVRCAECGIYAPRSESVTMGSQSFCSHEHARVYAARTAGQDRAAR